MKEEIKKIERKYKNQINSYKEQLTKGKSIENVSRKEKEKIEKKEEIDEKLIDSKIKNLPFQFVPNLKNTNNNNNSLLKSNKKVSEEINKFNEDFDKVVNEENIKVSRLIKNKNNNNNSNDIEKKMNLGNYSPIVFQPNLK